MDAAGCDGERRLRDDHHGQRNDGQAEDPARVVVIEDARSTRERHREEREKEDDDDALHGLYELITPLMNSRLSCIRASSAMTHLRSQLGALVRAPDPDHTPPTRRAARHGSMAHTVPGPLCGRRTVADVAARRNPVLQCRRTEEARQMVA